MLRLRLKHAPVFLIAVLTWCAGSNYTRAQDSGLILHLKANIGVVQNNGLVSKWLDQSGRGNDALMAIPLNQPELNDSSSNGLPAIRFRGQNYLQCPNIFPTNQDYSIVVVAKLDDGFPNNLVSGNLHALFLAWTDYPTVLHACAYCQKQAKIPMWRDGFSLIQIRYSSLDQQVVFYVNGEFADSAFVGPNPDSALLIGAFRNDNFLKGQIQEVQLYDRALSDAERVSIAKALMGHYAIAAAAPLLPRDSTFRILPQSMQLYQRAADDSATVEISGAFRQSQFDTAYVLTLKNGTLASRQAMALQFKSQAAPFSFFARIHAELSEYRFEVHVKNSTIDSTIGVADSVVCGDAILIDGQSNSAYGFQTYHYSNEFCRTVGHRVIGDPGDTAWHTKDIVGGEVGAWGLRFQQDMIEQYHIPCCIINSAVGGSPIEAHLANDTDRYNVFSLYGQELYKASVSKLKNDIRVIFWDQGESNYAAGYFEKFSNLYSSWKQDYPSLQKIYVIQMRPNYCDWGNIDMRDVQRGMQDSFQNIESIASAAIPYHDGCHYYDSGYLARGDRFFASYARDFLHATDTGELRSPNASWAWYTDPEHREAAVLFRPSGVQLRATNDTLVAGQLQTLKDYFFTDDTSLKVSAVSFRRDTMFLEFDRSSSARSIAYLPDQFYRGSDSVYEGPWIVNSRNYAALLWHTLTIHDGPMDVEQIPSAHPIAVYPNPSTNAATIDLSNSNGKVRLRVINELGVVLRFQTVVGGILQRIDYDGLAPGIYRLEVESQSGISFSNVVVR